MRSEDVKMKYQIMLSVVAAVLILAFSVGVLIVAM